MSSADQEFDAKVQETIRQVDEALAQATACSEQLDTMYKGVSQKRGAGRTLLEKQPPAERQKAEKELADFQAEVEQDLAHAAQQPSRTSPSRQMMSGRIRI